MRKPRLRQKGPVVELGGENPTSWAQELKGNQMPSWFWN